MTTALPDMSGSLVAADPPRAYGTFEVSLLDLEHGDESASVTTDADQQRPYGHQARSDSNIIDKNDANGDDDDRGCCSLCSQDDCCFVSAFVCAPVRLQTYKVLAFHLANVAFAALAAAWTLTLMSIKLVAYGPTAYNLESCSLHTLLQIDTALFNFVSSRHERVKQYSSSATRLEASNLTFDVRTHLYYGVAKLASSAVPGAIAATLFVWSLQRLCTIVLCAYPHSTNSNNSCDAVLLLAVPDDGASVGVHFLATAAQDRDVLLLLSVLAVLVAATLMHVVASIARHVTIVFCAQHLLYVAPV